MGSKWIPGENRDHIVVDSSGKNLYTEANKRNLKVIKGSKTIDQLITDEIDGFVKDIDGNPTPTRKNTAIKRTQMRNYWNL